MSLNSIERIKKKLIDLINCNSYLPIKVLFDVDPEYSSEIPRFLGNVNGCKFREYTISEDGNMWFRDETFAEDADDITEDTVACVRDIFPTCYEDEEYDDEEIFKLYSSIVWQQAIFIMASWE